MKESHSVFSGGNSLQQFILLWPLTKVNDNNYQMLDYTCISLSSLIFSYIFFVSRVTSEKGLKVLIYYEEDCRTNKTKSYVYKEVLQLLQIFKCFFVFFFKHLNVSNNAKSVYVTLFFFIVPTFLYIYMYIFICFPAFYAGS